LKVRTNLEGTSLRAATRFRAGPFITDISMEISSGLPGSFEYASVWAASYIVPATRAPFTFRAGVSLANSTSIFATSLESLGAIATAVGPTR
jgi:hypothetical protein